eukprot:27155_3
MFSFDRSKRVATPGLYTGSALRGRMEKSGWLLVVDYSRRELGFGTCLQATAFATWRAILSMFTVFVLEDLRVKSGWQLGEGHPTRPFAFGTMSKENMKHYQDMPIQSYLCAPSTDQRVNSGLRLVPDTEPNSFTFGTWSKAKRKLKGLLVIPQLSRPKMQTASGGLVAMTKKFACGTYHHQSAEKLKVPTMIPLLSKDQTGRAGLRWVLLTTSLEYTTQHSLRRWHRLNQWGHSPCVLFPTSKESSQLPKKTALFESIISNQLAYIHPKTLTSLLLSKSLGKIQISLLLAEGTQFSGICRVVYRPHRVTQTMSTEAVVSIARASCLFYPPVMTKLWSGMPSREKKLQNWWDTNMQLKSSLSREKENVSRHEVWTIPSGYGVWTHSKNCRFLLEHSDLTRVLPQSGRKKESKRRLASSRTLVMQLCYQNMTYPKEKVSWMEAKCVKPKAEKSESMELFVLLIETAYQWVDLQTRQSSGSYLSKEYARS